MQTCLFARLGVMDYLQAWEVVILMEWDELERARQFVASPDLKEAMQNAGVTDMPTITFLSQV